MQRKTPKWLYDICTSAEFIILHTAEKQLVDYQQDPLPGSRGASFRNYWRGGESPGAQRPRNGKPHPKSYSNNRIPKHINTWLRTNRSHTSMENFEGASTETERRGGKAFKGSRGAGEQV